MSKYKIKRFNHNFFIFRIKPTIAVKTFKKTVPFPGLLPVELHFKNM